MDEETVEERAADRFFTAAGSPPATGEQLATVAKLQAAVQYLATLIEASVPDNRNREIAFQSLEDVQMRANRALFQR